MAEVVEAPDARTVIGNSWIVDALFRWKRVDGPDYTQFDVADAILAALSEAGWTVAKLEQVGWIDYERDEEDRMRHAGYGRFALTEYGDHDGERYGNERVYRVIF